MYSGLTSKGGVVVTIRIHIMRQIRYQVVESRMWTQQTPAAWFPRATVGPGQTLSSSILEA